MLNKTLPALLLALPALLFAQGATAAPYCDALGDAGTIGKAYKRLAPVHSDRHAGWIIASDQLREDFALKTGALDLVARIVREVRMRGAELAILVPPPRPVLAGAQVRDAVLPASAGYDARAAAESFHGLMAQLSGVGAIAPDLLDALGREDEVYFRRDTHWTPASAAASAAALAQEIARTGAFGLDPLALPAAATPSARDTYDEKGSLARVIAEVCGIVPEVETVPLMDFPAQSGGLGLLDATPADAGPRIALLGTSFSDRYGRDAYRVADALAHATGFEVDNFSVSGGGALSAFEAYILSGDLDRKTHDLLVWEIPYTTAFKSISGLRQILGALQSSRRGAPLSEVRLPVGGEIRIDLLDGAMARGGGVALDGMLIAVEGPGKLRGVVHYDNGSQTRVSFYRSARMPAAQRALPMFLSLDESHDRRPVAVDLSLGPKDPAGASVSVFPRH